MVKGPHRGYMGHVQQATDTHCRVELDANNKVVMVKREFVTAGDEVHSRGAAPAGGVRLPPRTPMHVGAGARTPHYTPGYAGAASGASLAGGCRARVAGGG